jgi:hypothetical protein
MLLIACSPRFQIQTDTPFPGDFDNYQSFKFFNPANMPASNFSFDEGAKKVIYDAVATEMKARGYKSIQAADLMIKIQGGTKSSVEIRRAITGITHTIIIITTTGMVAYTMILTI